MATIIELDGDFYRRHKGDPDHFPLYWNYPNQLRRAIGFTPHETVHVDTSPHGSGGTVRDCTGKCWDWWTTDEPAPVGHWKIIKVIPAE